MSMSKRLFGDTDNVLKPLQQQLDKLLNILKMLYFIIHELYVNKALGK